MTSSNDSVSIRIRCIPDNIHCLSGVVNTKRVRFDIETCGNKEGTRRNPLNIVLVLDCSGSMEAENKLVFAKDAAKSVLKLLDDDDVVHLVTYESQTAVIFENARASSREQLYRFIDDIESAGSTNMSGGITLGASLIEKHTYEGFSQRMFVFSDGQANVGLKTCAELTNLVSGYNKKGIITDSFGIGGDFNSEIMKGIADAGGSRFYFLSKPEMIEMLTSKALMCVFGVCASGVRLLVRGRNGSIVTKLWGYDDVVAGASLGDLFINNLRSVLCEFTVSPSNNGDLEALVYELKYNQSNDLNGEPMVIKDTLTLQCVDDQLLLNGVDPRVKITQTCLNAAEIDKKIAQLVEKGQRKEAMTLVEQQLLLLNEAKALDDERGTIALLIQLAEHMQTKLKDTTVDHKIIAHGYQHHAYLKEDMDDEEMDFGLFD